MREMFVTVWGGGSLSLGLEEDKGKKEDAKVHSSGGRGTKRGGKRRGGGMDGQV